MPTVTIIGGGLAGFAIAHCLAKRNISCTILEAEEDIAQHASGNIAGIIMPHLTIEKNIISDFYSLGLTCLNDVLNEFKQDNISFSGEFCGVLKFPSSNRLKQLHSDFNKLLLNKNFAEALSQKETTALLGFETKSGSIFFKNAGWIEPSSLCRASFKKYRDLISIKTNTNIKRIQKTSNNFWQTFDHFDSLISETKILVVASAYHASEFPQLSFLPLEKVRGQVTHLKSHQKSSMLKHVVCYDGYLTPSINNTHLLGATFNHNDERTEIIPEQNIELLNRLKKWLPDFPITENQIISSRVNFRTMGKTRLPIVGEVNNSNLFVSLAHAAKGLLSCYSCGEIVVNNILGDTMSFPKEILEYLSPNRYTS